MIAAMKSTLANLHIVVNDCVHESRILKETKVIAEMLPADCAVVIASTNRSGQLAVEQVDCTRRIERIAVKFGGALPRPWRTIVEFPIWAMKVITRYAPLRPAVVNVHHAEALPIGLIMKLLAGSKLVYDPHELEAEKAGTTKSKRRTIRVIERICMKFVDAMFVVNDSIADEYTKRYNIRRPTVVVNAPALDRTPRAGVPQLLRNTFQLRPDQKICLYIGGLVAGRGIDLILEAFSNPEQTRYVAVFMGFGPLESNVRAAAKRSGSIFLHPPVPPDQVLQYAASADVGLVCIEPISKSYELALPNKLFECIFSGVPVVVSDLPELRRIVTNYEVGSVMRGNTPQHLLNAVTEALGLDGIVFNRALLRLKREYAWDAQASKIVDQMLALGLGAQP